MIPLSIFGKNMEQKLVLARFSLNRSRQRKSLSYADLRQENVFFIKFFKGAAKSLQEYFMLPCS